MKSLFPPTGLRLSRNTGYLASLVGSAGKESACNVEDLGSIPGLKRSSVEGNRYPLQYSGLENSMDCIVHGVTKESDRTERLSLSLFRNTVYLILLC